MADENVAQRVARTVGQFVRRDSGTASTATKEDAPDLRDDDAVNINGSDDAPAGSDELGSMLDESADLEGFGAGLMDNGIALQGTSALLGGDAAGAALLGSMAGADGLVAGDRKSTRLNSSHLVISYAVFCL